MPPAIFPSISGASDLLAQPSDGQTIRYNASAGGYYPANLSEGGLVTTVTDANGLVLSGGVLSMSLASNGGAGSITTGTFEFINSLNNGTGVLAVASVAAATVVVSGGINGGFFNSSGALGVGTGGEASIYLNSVPFYPDSLNFTLTTVPFSVDVGPAEAGQTITFTLTLPDSTTESGSFALDATATGGYTDQYITLNAVGYSYEFLTGTVLSGSCAPAYNGSTIAISIMLAVPVPGIYAGGGILAMNNALGSGGGNVMMDGGSLYMSTHYTGFNGSTAGSIYMSSGSGTGGGNVWMDGGKINVPSLTGSYTAYGQTAGIGTGTFNAGGGGGVSIFCSVGYELNWQAGILNLSGGSIINFSATAAGNYNLGTYALQLSAGGQIMFNGTSDQNWRAGLGLGPGAFTTINVGNSTAIQVVFGAGNDGPDGLALGATGGQSAMELRGYDLAAFFYGLVSMSDGLAVTGGTTSLDAGEITTDGAGNMTFSTGGISGNAWGITGSNGAVYFDDDAISSDGSGNFSATSGSFGTVSGNVVTTSVIVEGGSPSAVPVTVRSATQTIGIALKELSVNVATLVSGGSVPFSVGDTVVVAGIDSTFDGTFIVTGLPSGNSFTYALVAADVAYTACAGTATKNQTADLQQWQDSSGSVLAGVSTAGVFLGSGAALTGIVAGQVLGLGSAALQNSSAFDAAGTASSDVATHAALSATHGISSTIVGATESQTLTHKNLTDASNTFPAFNQNTTGTAANITATTNSTLVTLSSLSLPVTQVTGISASGSGALTLGYSAGAVSGSIAAASASVPGTMAASDYSLLHGMANITTVTPSDGLTFSGGTLSITGSNITTVGTVTSGTWNATTVSAAHGGTGVANNALSTITISGAYGITFTVSNTTAVTLPTAGTLLTTTGSGTGLSGVLLVSGGQTLTGSLNMGTNTLTGLPVPVNASDAATKSYVDATVQGLQVKQTATAATTAALPSNTYASGVLTAVATGALTVDGHLTVSGDVLLVKNEATSANDGLYTVTTVGASGVAYVLTRAADMSLASEFPGAFIPVSGGTANANSLWLCAASNLVLGVTATGTLSFTQLNGATDLTAGTGITIAGNTISVTSNTYSPLAGSSSIVTVGTLTGGSVPSSLVTGLAVTSVTNGGGLSVSGGVLSFSGTAYAPTTTGTAILKGNNTGGFSSAVAGTDYLAPGGSGAALTGITAAQIGLGNVTNNLQLTAANNLSDLASVPAAQANLGVSLFTWQTYGGM